jgi:hypothetical protein
MYLMGQMGISYGGDFNYDYQVSFTPIPPMRVVSIS